MGASRLNQAPKSMAVLENCERWSRTTERLEAICTGAMAAGVVAIMGQTLAHLVPWVTRPSVCGIALGAGIATAVYVWRTVNPIRTLDYVACRALKSDVVELLQTATLATGRLSPIVVSHAEDAAQRLLLLPLPRRQKPRWFGEAVASILLALLIGIIPSMENARDARSVTRVREVASSALSANFDALSDAAGVDEAIKRLRDPKLSLESARSIASTLDAAASASDPTAAIERLKVEPEWNEVIAASATSGGRDRLRSFLAGLPPETRARLADALKDASKRLSGSVASRATESADQLAAGASGAASAAEVVGNLVRLERARRDAMDIAIALRSAAGAGATVASPPDASASGATSSGPGDLSGGERRVADGPDAAIVRRYFELRDQR